MSVKVVGPTLVINFDCPKDVARLRFLDRARGDDSSEIFDRRYAEFQANNPTILRRYDNVVHTVRSILPALIAL
jgi:adenylate kinase family enzyme